MVNEPTPGAGEVGAFLVLVPGIGLREEGLGEASRPLPQAADGTLIIRSF